MNIVQIGCNDGNDHVLEFIKQNIKSITSLHLVDALPDCIEKIKHTYSFLECAHFYNLCISNNHLKQQTIFCPTQERHGGNTSQLASMSENHLIGHDVKDYRKMVIDSLNINTFLKNININQIDKLYIDVEGLDCDLILELNLDVYNIPYIRFETVHSDGPYTKKEKFTLVKEKLILHNYKIHELSGEIEATR